MSTKKYLDYDGLKTLWSKVKSYVASATENMGQIYEFASIISVKPTVESSSVDTPDSYVYCSSTGTFFAVKNSKYYVNWTSTNIFPVASTDSNGGVPKIGVLYRNIYTGILYVGAEDGLREIGLQSETDIANLQAEIETLKKNSITVEETGEVSLTVQTETL